MGYSNVDGGWRVDGLEMRTLSANEIARLFLEHIEDDRDYVFIENGIENYVFVYNGENRDETLRILGRFADNSDLSFTWCDATRLSLEIRNKSLSQKDMLIISRVEKYF